MRIDAVQVELRPRSPWEAVELGMALVRRHAGAIWRPWMLATWPVFAVLNAAAWALDAMWLAALAMWWLLPLFDRIPLFVLSRAVFGEVPTARQVLAAQRHWGWRAMAGRLGWRRFSPWRATMLPVELLEGSGEVALRQRRRVVGDGIQGHAFLLTLVCQGFVLSLVVSLLSLALMFVPMELLSESARAMWALVTDDPPRGARLAVNAALWLAMSAIEPFFVGAGFGLYLNRRVRIEAWDIEIALRRLRARVGALAPVLVVALSLAWLLPAPASAQGAQRPGDDRERAAVAPAPVVDPARDEQGWPDDGRPTLEEVFGKGMVVDHKPFRQAVKRAFEDPLLDRSRVQTRWEKRKPDEPRPPPNPSPMLQALARLFALLGEYGLWLVVGVLVVVLAATARRWWPWMQGLARERVPEQDVELSPVPLDEALPQDLVAEVRRLWREGRPRRALALLYRGSVEAMASRIGTTLVPGATEAECLRAARRLPDAGDRDAFARMVRVWQYAAYAQHLPEAGEFEALLGELAQRFGWAR